MARMLTAWEHTLERMLERVRPEHHAQVQKRIADIMEPAPMESPPEAVGHYEWYIDVYGDRQEINARIMCRGITLRTVYGPLMPGGIPAPKPGVARYKLDTKARKLVKAK